MGYICDRAHHLEIHENERSDKRQLQEQNDNGGVATNTNFDDEDICKRQHHDNTASNRKINQDHLATTTTTTSVSAVSSSSVAGIGHAAADDDGNLIVANDSDLDYNFYKYRKEKSPHSSISLETIVGYANNFLVKLGKLAQQYVEVVSEHHSSSTSSAVKINVKSGSQSRKNNAINPSSIRVASSSRTSSLSSTNKRCSVKTGNHAAASGDEKSKRIATTTHHHPSSHHHNSCGLVKHSLCLYAASSIIIALCYLTTPIVAYDGASSV